MLRIVTIVLVSLAFIIAAGGAALAANKKTLRPGTFKRCLSTIEKHGYPARSAAELCIGTATIRKVQPRLVWRP